MMETAHQTVGAPVCIAIACVHVYLALSRYQSKTAFKPLGYPSHMFTIINTDSGTYISLLVMVFGWDG